MGGVINGADRLHAATFLRGKRLGLIASPSGVTQDLRLTLDALHAQFTLTALYAPEHGARGDAEAGEWVASYTDARTGLPVYSLYGSSKKPTADMLADIDLLVLDVQDIGCRYYTFISTMRLCMEACAENGKAFAVLDRPNPINGTTVEGNLVQKDFESFVGCAPIPVRHALTLGEMAQLFNAEYSINCELHILPVENWQRELYADQTNQPWVNPSPNMPCLDAALLYPGTCLFEGTNLSEGRGTTKPFELFGAPWLDATDLAEKLNARNPAGLRFRPVYFKPTFSKHAGQLCGGVQAHIIDRRALQPLAAGLVMLDTVREISGAHFAWIPPFMGGDGRNFIDLLCGSDTLRTKGTAAFVQECAAGVAAFAPIREKYLLY